MKAFVRARIIDGTADVGSIARGRCADLVLCAGDPLKSSTDSAQIAAVYKDGKPVYAADSALLATAREGSPP